MSQENPEVYYMVVDEKSTGPYSLAEVILHPKLTKETLIWKPGLENWVAADTLTELAPVFASQQNREFRVNPPEYTSENQDSPNNFANNPQYQPGHTYRKEDHYYHGNHRFQSGYRPNYRTNWLPWAIVATIIGFFTSCIGAIFGIIGIIQANKANSFYSQGLDIEGDAANSNAKIMTIIGLIFAGIGIIAFFWFGSVFSTFSNYYNL